ncbi:MAG: carbohydrate kinase family protein [Anaerolineae bacterium]
MPLQYFTAGGLRIDYVITADGQVHLREMGGNAIYSAVGARIWAAQVGILSRIGENYPQEWLSQLEHAGICIEGIRMIPGWQDMRTFYAYLDLETRVDTEPERHFARLGLPVPDDLSGYVHSTPGQDSQEFMPLSPRPADLPPAYLEVRAAHLSPLEFPSHRALSRTLAERRIRVSLDPGERYMRPALAEDIFSFLCWVDAFLPSEQEVESLLGKGDLWQAAARFAEAGPAVVVIKAGSKGSLIYDRYARKKWLIPPYPTRVVDVTGAGDAYCGGFMVGYDETQDPVLAGCYGSVSASFVLEGFGALYATRYTRTEAEERLAYVRHRVQPA